MKESVNIEIAKMRSLMERMEKPFTNYQAVINEQNHINEAKWASNARLEIKNPNDFFDILANMRTGWYAGAGYVTAAKLGRDKVKRKNPATNRMKGYEDYEGLGEDLNSPMSGLFRLTMYNFQWQDLESLDKDYAEFKDASNAIRAKYGAPPIGDRPDYKQKMNYGKGIEVYGGNNKEKEGNVYIAQNMANNAEKNSAYYAIDESGHIIDSFEHSELKEYLLKQDPITKDSGANALKRMNVEEEKIKAYFEEISTLKMKYRSLLANNLLYLCATLPGDGHGGLKRVIWVNPNLESVANDIQVDPNDFAKIVNDFYGMVGLHSRTPKP